MVCDHVEIPYDFIHYSIPENCDGKNILMKTGFILFHCGIINIYIYVLTLIYSKLSFVFIPLCVNDVSKIALERDKIIMENIDKTGTRLTSKAKHSL